MRVAEDETTENDNEQFVVKSAYTSEDYENIVRECIADLLSALDSHESLLVQEAKEKARIFRSSILLRI